MEVAKYQNANHLMNTAAAWQNAIILKRVPNSLRDTTQCGTKKLGE